MEEDRSNEYEEMMKSDEDFEEDVVEEDADPIERNIENEIKKVGIIKSEEDIVADDVEIEEKEDIQEESKEEVHLNEEISVPVEDNPKEEMIIQEEEKEIEEKPVLKEEPELESEQEVKEDSFVIPVKKENNKTIKPKVRVKRSKIKKAPIRKKITAKVTSKRRSSKKKKTPMFPIAYSLIGIAIIILAIFLLTKTTTQTVTAAAIVNGEEISMNDLDKEYEFFFLIGGLPEEYKQQIKKEFFLNSTLIPERLILAEAEKNNIQVTEEEVDAFVKNSVEQAGSTIENFESTINNIGLTLNDIKGYFKKQLISFKLLNATILGEIKVDDMEIEATYNENKEVFDAQNQTLDDIKEDLKNALLIQKQRTAAQIYINQLIKNADITVYYTGVTSTTTPDIGADMGDFSDTEEEPIEEVVIPESTADITTFTETDDSLCEEDGKPILRMYSTSWCPHCKWIKDTFNSIAQEYIDLEKVNAYHWQLDTGDDELTIKTETSVPRSEIELFQKYNPEGYVPVFVLGCKYFRVGNGYEAENDLTAEEAEFKAVINSLI